jgi:microsomal dipeptidase-like Zn-dependent dipeptidase
MENLYFDLHFHPLFKTALKRFEEKYPSKRLAEDLLGELRLRNILTREIDDEILHFLQSQCCIEQLNEGNLKVGVFGIAPIELGFAASKGLIAKLLHSGFLTNPLDQKYFDKISSGEISYYGLFARELNLYRILQDTKNITILSRKNYKSLKNLKGISLALSIEGGHSLLRYMVNKPGIRDRIEMENGSKSSNLIDDFNGPPTMSAAESLKRLTQALWLDEMDICYLTLTHLTHIDQQLLATHAFGFKLIKHQAALPIGFGLTAAGKEVIDAAYSMNVKNADGTNQKLPIYIDIKHMGLKSRLDFYNYRREKSYTTPILATHMGITGYSIQEWTSSLDDAKLSKKNQSRCVELEINRSVSGFWGFLNKKYTYNSWSINLMDDDIIEILNSAGLIGISLDIRILGIQSLLGKGDKSEYMSTEDFRYFFPKKWSEISNTPYIEITSLDAEESFAVPEKEDRHPLAIALTIVHIVSTGLLNTKVDPWLHLCIGSDFDGLIDPIINCRSAKNYNKLESSLIQWLPVAEEIYRKEHAGPPILQRTNPNEVDQDDLKQKVRKIMYDNGYAFIEKWLKGS